MNETLRTKILMAEHKTEFVDLAIVIASDPSVSAAKRAAIKKVARLAIVGRESYEGLRRALINAI